jgi:hypothetical protein
MLAARSALLLLAMMIGNALPALAESVTLFRVFLNDGTAVVSYGEFARVGDRLVFSMPIGEADAVGSPNLHVVNLPISAVNWTATEQYAASARYSHYVKTSAESDYAALAGDVAATLNAIVLADDPKARLNLAVAARRRLATWPRDHYGYRAADVREMLGLLDEAISGLRAAAGETSFAIDLVATTAPPQVGLMSLMDAPTPTEAINNAIAVARATDVASDRVSILRSVVGAIDQTRSALSAGWAVTTRRWALQTINEELKIDRKYAELTAIVMKRASTAAGRADVREVESVLIRVERTDAALGKRRPEEINALIEQVRVQLDAARRLRLARDQWQERSFAFRGYLRSVQPIVNGLVKARRNLDDIKRLAGSDATQLVGLATRFGTNSKTLSALSVPDPLKPAHALLTSAVNLAETAAKTRRQATISGELQLAWDASSAAAGALMLLSKAQEEMEATLRFPQIR